MKKKIFRGAILLVALALIGIGIWQEDFRDVMSKAIRICYECIGIG